MASMARLAYERAAGRAEILRRKGVSVSKKGKNDEAQILYHAALAFHVSAWQSFVASIIHEFFDITRMPAQASYNVMHGLSERKANLALKKFFTANWENTRNLFVSETGFDPYNCWIWPARNWGVNDVKDRLNQILQVRHSFAHGFPLPSVQWTISNSGEVRLTTKALSDTKYFFENMVRRSDQNMNTFIRNSFGINPGWY